MNNNKIVYFGETLMDLTSDTVSPEKLLTGATAHDKSGTRIVGTMNPGSVTSDATATAADILSPKTAYIATGKVTGQIPTKSAADITASGATVTVPSGYYASQATKSVPTATQATPSVSVNPVNGAVTASVTQDAGYVSGGTTSATEQLPTQAAATITPSTTAQTAVAAGKYTTGAVTVEGSANLVDSNIKKNVTIFGVTGTLEAGSDTSDATATAADILSGTTAYIATGKVSGSMPKKTATDVTVTDNVVSVPVGYYGAAVSQTVGTAQAAQTITPTTTDQTIPAGTYLTGAQTIKGSVNLLDSNIKKSVNIFGVVGTLEAGSDTSDATATADDILAGTTAYIATGKVSGTIQTRTSTDVTVSGADVSIPKGYYGSAVTKSVAAGSATIPATSVTANPTISVDSAGLITSSISASKSVTPSVTEGYVSSGTAGTLSVSGSATEQLPVQAAATITPTSTAQTAVAAGKYTTGAVTVAAIPYVEEDNASGGKTVTIG